MPEARRMMTMNCDGFWTNYIDKDDNFFESRNRISTSSAVSVDLASSSNDDNENRVSFDSAISSAPSEELRSLAASPMAAYKSMSVDYGIWMAEPGSVKERRKRLLQGMGLSGDKALLRLNTNEFKRAASAKIGSPLLVSSALAAEESKQEAPSLPSPSPANVLVRSKSEGDTISIVLNAKNRKEQLTGVASIRHLMRSSSAPSALRDRRPRIHSTCSIGSTISRNCSISLLLSNNPIGTFFVIKNLDTGKEFIMNEFDEDGKCNRLFDLGTGKQLTVEEFDKDIGHSPIVKELMRRENVSRVPEGSIVVSDRKVGVNVNYLSRSFRQSKRRGVAWLKNIKDVANTMSGFIGDKEREYQQPAMEQRSTKSCSSSEWMKVRQHGKCYKELTGLHLCQEIQAHQGSIWTIRFSSDTRYLASAGEDRVIHVWEVLDCKGMSLRVPDEGNSTALYPMACRFPERPPLAEVASLPSERKRRGKLSSCSRKESSFPEYVVVPDTVFSLSEKPVCSFQGHLDDVLDLSWSKSQLLLSSSMDKTVRLWDMETKSCLKLFAHSDYVTCIQFNPIDDRYFISGSLDAKVRIWSIPDRQVVDWTDLHEMVTAACYTPDGQGALIGSHKGTCRLYNTSECTLNQKGLIDIRNKKKCHAKKITGFQFAPGNPSEVLITSADSRIRVFDGYEVIHKFRGFRNTSSQISASFTADGRYVVSASEDSQVYVWKREEIHHAGSGKNKGQNTTRSHEHFQCRDVSVAIPWPGSIKGEPPTIPLHSKRHQKRPSNQPPLSRGSVTLEDVLVRTGSKRHLPPIPKKISLQEKASTCTEEKLAKATRSNSGIGERTASFTSASSSFKYGDSHSVSSSGHYHSSSWSWFDSITSNGSRCIQATAWGMVIVTAGLGGEIRAYQNFGLPIPLGSQTNLFKDLT